jgi:sulfoxide reductase catalytic subunit YedY
MRRRSPDSTPIVPSDITPESKFRSRRAIIAGGLGVVFVQTFGLERRSVAQDTAGALNFTRNAQFSVTYEFCTGKSDPSTNSQQFHTRPWTVTIDGECEVKGTLSLGDILKPNPLEERIYRMRH